MQINSMSNSPNFGRALCTEEKNDYKKLINEARNKLGIKDTTAIVFDFSVPAERLEISDEGTHIYEGISYNTGIGSSNSDEMIKFTGFMKDMLGITSIQLGPQGELETKNHSPYRSTNFAIGGHIIDLGKLTKKEHCCLLPKKYLTDADYLYPKDKHEREYKVDYEYALGADNNSGIYNKFIAKAKQSVLYLRLLFDKDGYKLNSEMNSFKYINKKWVEPEVLFRILTKKYGTDDINKWSYEDRNLYSNDKRNSNGRLYNPDEIEKIRYLQKKKILDENEEMSEVETFKIYMASKQQAETKKELNDKNIKVYGDAHMGFSKSEVWANIDCFNRDSFYVDDEHNINNNQMCALNYDKIGSLDDNQNMSGLDIAGKLIYDKYKTLFQRYDKLRIDSAWQLESPLICKKTDGGMKIIESPCLNDTVLNIIKKAAKDAQGSKYNDNNILLDYSDREKYDRTEIIQRSNFSRLYTDNQPNDISNPSRKYSDVDCENYYVGVGNHNSKPVIEIKKSDNTKFGFDERNQIFSRLFTKKNQFITLTDIFGMEKGINDKNNPSDNDWTFRLPSTYEKFYFNQLKNGYGVNMPLVLETLLREKYGTDSSLLKKLHEAGEILKQNGPMTEMEANLYDRKGNLGKKFSYES